MFTMWIYLLVASVAVAAIKVDPSNIRDHALAQPKTDFSAFKDGHFGDSDSGRDQNSKSADRHELSGPEFDHREFSEFNHRQFHHRDMGEVPGFGLTGLNFGDYYGGGGRSFGSMFNNEESNRRGVENRDQRGMESSYRHRSHVQKTNSGSKMPDHRESDIFDSETKIHGRNIESHSDRDNSNQFHQSTGFREYNSGFQNKDFQERYGQQGFQNRDINRRDFENINDKFGENSDVQRNFHQIQGFTSHLNNKPEYNGRLVESQNQRLQNKGDVVEEVATTKNKRKAINTSSENHYTESSVQQKINRSENNYDRKLSNNLTAKDRNIPVNRPNIDTTTTKYNIVTDLPYNDGDRSSEDAEYEQRPRFKPTTENEILPVHQNRTESRMGEDVEDRWIWGDGGGKQKPTTATKTNPVPDISDLDDRTAFNGDKCPKGKKRFGDMCVDED